MIQTVAIFAVFALGVVFSLIGAVKLQLAEKLQIDDAKVGGLISTLMFTSIIVVLIIGPLVDAWGHKPFAILGFLTVGLAIYLFSTFSSYKGVVFACVLLGVGGMCVNTVGNTLMPKVLFGGQNESAALNLGNMFFGLGAFITPFLAGLLMKKLGFSRTINIIAVVTFIPIVFAFMAQYPALPSAGYELSNAFGLLANPVVLIAALALFCYIGLEASMGGWITTYLTTAGLSAEKASGLLSAFWIGIMVSRLITAGVVTPGMGVTVILSLALVATVSLLIMSFSRNNFLAGLAVVLTGLAFGPIFPTIIGVTFSKIDPALHGSVFAIIFAIGLLGATTLPAAMGFISRGKGIQRSMLAAAVTAGVLVVVSLVMGTM